VAWLHVCHLPVREQRKQSDESSQVRLASSLLVLGSAEEFTPKAQRFLFSLRIFRPLGNGALERLDQLGTVEKTGPSALAFALDTLMDTRPLGFPSFSIFRIPIRPSLSFIAARISMRR
jgi:hypothetical protein